MTSKNKINLFSFILFTIILSSLISSLFFKEKWLWMDEVLSYTLLSDSSWAHMNRAIVSCLDANPPLFFNLYWPVAHWGSLNPFFLKSFSIVLFAVSIVIFYRYVTRLIDRPVSNFVIITFVVAFTYLNYTLSTQIRAYSWYFLLCFLFFMTMHRLVLKPESKLYLFTHLSAGIVLVLTHNFGLFYAASSLGLFILLLLWSKKKVYWIPILSHSVIFGTWLLLWFSNFQIQSQVGKPYSWIPVPTFTSFFRTVGELLPSISSRLEQSALMGLLPLLRVAVMVVIFLYLAIPKLKAGFKVVVASSRDSFYLLSGYIILSTICIALTVSLIYKSVFLSRYIWVNELLFLFQIIYAYDIFSKKINYVSEAGIKSIVYRFTPVYVLCVAFFMFYQSQKISMFPSKILSYLPKLESDYPVFFESADYFLPIWHHKLVNAFFLLDRSTATRKDNLRNASNDYNVISSLRDKYHVKNVVPIRDFNKLSFREFYVVDESSRIQIEQFIKSGQVKVLETIPVNIEGHQILKCTFNK